ncbi:predicted protein [Nematostella vectensis]|uniref:Uncharacterized protein n=1 Tax=Nematostella vectensis TaxID=45351 RepID=A7SDJ8_NEMVE|nr:predicted protein [Nematostella vectensis]|eukprot:XP_001630333.1 predicted protein [Nematostella vectensis]
MVYGGKSFWYTCGNKPFGPRLSTTGCKSKAGRLAGISQLQAVESKAGHLAGISQLQAVESKAGHLAGISQLQAVKSKAGHLAGISQLQAVESKAGHLAGISQLQAVESKAGHLAGISQLQAVKSKAGHLAGISQLQAVESVASTKAELRQRKIERKRKIVEINKKKVAREAHEKLRRQREREELVKVIKNNYIRRKLYVVISNQHKHFHTLIFAPQDRAVALKDAEMIADRRTWP